MKAEKLFEEKFAITLKNGKVVVVFMDLYKVNSYEYHPEGYRYSWIGFNPDNPDQRVLFDSHPPKGPHLHIDLEVPGTSYNWENLEKAFHFFMSKIKERFGEF